MVKIYFNSVIYHLYIGISSAIVHRFLSLIHIYQALATAAKQAVNSQDDVITLFVKEYRRIAPDAKLSELFATQQLKDKVNQKSSDAEVEKVLRSEVKAAVENS